MQNMGPIARVLDENSSEFVPSDDCRMPDAESSRSDSWAAGDGSPTPSASATGHQRCTSAHAFMEVPDHSKLHCDDPCWDTFAMLCPAQVDAMATMMIPCGLE